jgi:hypothetical protein
MLATRSNIERFLLIVIALGSIAEGVRLIFQGRRLATSDVLGPAPYILGLGVLLLVTTLIDTLGTNPTIDTRAGAGSGGQLFSGKLASIFLVLCTYAVLIEICGYLISTVVLFVLQFRLYGVKSWVVSSIAAVVAAVLFHLVFVKYAGMVFPRGLLWG